MGDVKVCAQAPMEAISSIGEPIFRCWDTRFEMVLCMPWLCRGFAAPLHSWVYASSPGASAQQLL